MAAARRRLPLGPPLLLLALLLCAQAPFSLAGRERQLDRRFAEYKRCADPECSLLMCRGKALKDFEGPDCRFVNFKEGESVYVYYKLTGRTNDLWAGSVGSEFGYFPKDLLEIKHIYTDDELELPTDETDFVCFDGGKDNFDNYDVDELLQLSKDEATDDETELDIEKEEAIGGDYPTEFTNLETEGVDADSDESNDDHAKVEEQDHLHSENNENIEGALDSRSMNLAVNSDTKNPQVDQSAYQPLEEVLQETLKVPDHESAKNSNISQGEVKHSDFRVKDDGAYTLQHQENLKTKFGSTADVLVSDDETTSLVTSLDHDVLDIDSYDAEKLEELKEQSEEMPLIAFIDESKSSEHPEAKKLSNDDIFESETNDPDEVSFIDEKKDESSLLTHSGDKIFATVSGDKRKIDESDRFRMEEEEEEEVEVEVEEEDDHDNDSEEALVSKKEKSEDGLVHSEVSSDDDPITSEHDHITEQIHNVDAQDSKEKRYDDFEEKNVKIMVAHGKPKQLQSSSVHNFDGFYNDKDGLESKASIETKEETLKSPLSDSNNDPEGFPLHSRIRDDERTQEKNLKDTKHKMLWETLSKKRDGNEQSMNAEPELLEELTNESQSDLDESNFLEGKTKDEAKQEEDNFTLRSVNNEKQANVSAMENTPTEDTEAVNKKPKQETETQHSEEGGRDEDNLALSISKETPENRTIEEKSTSATQYGNVSQQNIVHTENEHSDEAISVGADGEESSLAEFQSADQEAKDIFQDEPEEELLQDENAESAQLSKETFAHKQGFTLDVDRTTPEAEISNGAILRATNPVDEMGEEAITVDLVKRDDSMQDPNQDHEDLLRNDMSQLSEMKEGKEEEQEGVEPSALSEAANSMVSEKHQIQNVNEEIHPSNLNISEAKHNRDSFNQTLDYLTEDFSEKDLRDIQISTESTEDKSRNPSGPRDASESAKEAVEPEYGVSVLQLTIMKEFLDEKRIARLKKYLGQQHILRIESLFHDMELELMLAQKHDKYEEIEEALDQILESSESNVLDVVDKILDSRQEENREEVVKEMDFFDEEAALMDDVQELMYSLRQKYSPTSESTPLASLPQSKLDSNILTTANTEQTDYGRHFVEDPNETKDQMQEPQDTEKMSKQEESLPLNQPEEAVNILEEPETLHGTESEDVFHSDKPHVDSTLESVDSPINNARDFIAGIISNTDDITEERENPPETDSSAPHIDTALYGEAPLAKEIKQPFIEILTSTLPESMRPGPDFHGLPWEPIVITAFVGIATLAVFFWRTCLSVKRRMYQVTEKQLGQKIETLLKEKTEILKKMSEYDQKIKEAKESMEEAQKQNIDLSEEASVLKDAVKELKETNKRLDDRMRNLHTMLEMEKDQNLKKQEQIIETQKSLEKLQEVITVHSVELSEVQIALNEAKLSEEKVKSKLCHVQEENIRLKKSKAQLLQEAEGWSERHAELNEQISMYQKSQKDIEEALAYKENEVEVLTNCIMQLKQLDADSETEGKNDEGSDLANGELSDGRNEKMKTQIKQMMDVSRVRTTLSIIEEDRDLLQSKLNDERAIRHELEERIQKLEHESSLLQTAKSQLDSECKTLHQKVEILNELYQQKEMALQKKLTQEEYERQEKEQKLSAADEKAVFAIEEVKVYKQRIHEMEEELQKTERSYKDQIASHEKKAHDNWLIARSAERALAEEKREAANLRQKLIEVNQKLAVLQRPLIVKPTPGRPDVQVPPRRGPLSQDGSFGPSPVSGGAPSPPLMIEPPGRPLSANPREGSRGDLSVALGNGPPISRRHPELSGRMSAPDLGPAVSALMNCGPRTSSPSSTVMDGMVNINSKGPPPFLGPPMMTSPGPGPLPPPVRFGPPPRAPYGPRPLPLTLVRGAPPLPPPPIPRDYPPGPSFGMRDVPPGPLPPPEQRGYLRGPPPFRPPTPRDYPAGPRLPPHGLRDYSPSVRDLLPPGTSDFQGGPPRPPSPASLRDSAHHPDQKP